MSALTNSLSFFGLMKTRPHFFCLFNRPRPLTSRKKGMALMLEKPCVLTFWLLCFFCVSQKVVDGTAFVNLGNERRRQRPFGLFCNNGRTGSLVSSRLTLTALRALGISSDSSSCPHRQAGQSPFGPLLPSLFC